MIETATALFEEFISVIGLCGSLFFHVDKQHRFIHLDTLQKKEKSMEQQTEFELRKIIEKKGKYKGIELSQLGDLVTEHQVATRLSKCQHHGILRCHKL